MDAARVLVVVVVAVVARVRVASQTPERPPRL
jgi:hypothetical protein